MTTPEFLIEESFLPVSKTWSGCLCRLCLLTGNPELDKNIQPQNASTWACQVFRQWWEDTGRIGQSEAEQSLFDQLFHLENWNKPGCTITVRVAGVEHKVDSLAAFNTLYKRAVIGRNNASTGQNSKDPIMAPNYPDPDLPNGEPVVGDSEIPF